MNELVTSEAFIGLITDQVRNYCAFASLLPRSIRVRRRGFRPSVKRGDIVSHAGKRWNVARRSNWSLWLYEHVEMRGDTITVRLPTRYTVPRESDLRPSDEMSDTERVP